MLGTATVPAARRWGAILLAGGASTRFGGAPKALLDLGGEPAVVRMAQSVEQSGFGPAVAVAGVHARATRAALAPLGVPVVENPEWSGGRTGSIQVALDALGDVDGALLWPVDHPFVRAATLATVRRVAESDDLALWVIPTFAGHGGHPVLLRQETFAAIRDLRPDAPLRSLLPSFGPQVRRVPVDDPAVVENIDRPEAFQAAIDRRRTSGSGDSWTGG